MAAACCSVFYGDVVAFYFMLEVLSGYPQNPGAFGNIVAVLGQHIQ